MPKSRVCGTVGNTQFDGYMGGSSLKSNIYKKDGYRQQNVRQRQKLISFRGLSRSLKLMPFESLGAVSYSPSIVTMAVSAAILEIFNVKEWPYLEI